MSTMIASSRIDQIGDEAPRPDGAQKVSGAFEFASDLSVPGMLWGLTVRSPHPRAQVRHIDATSALAMPGVHAVLTVDDVPGARTFGLMASDQPVLADGVVRFTGEPVALIAAVNQTVAKAAAAAIQIDYDVLPALTEARVALSTDSPQVHPDGNLLRHARIRRGDSSKSDGVVVRGKYVVGTQDQAALGLEAGLAIPQPDGGVEVWAATQFAHVDRDQLAASLAVLPDKIRIVVAGIGGAFGAREDLSVQLHCALLACATGRPVKMVYSRHESFVGHVHRHPATMEYEHTASADGRLLAVRAKIVLDGGAYMSTSAKVAVNAAAFAVGPYDIDSVYVDVFAVRTNNPPNGAMRGFGATQVCFAYEAQMNRLATALGMDPLELRRRNALSTGRPTATGQVPRGEVAVPEIIDRLGAMADPPASKHGPSLHQPGGTGNTSHGEGIARGVGFALGWKAFCFAEGYDDSAEARVRLRLSAQGPVAEVHSAAAEMGQGTTTIQQQVARTELQVSHVVLESADTTVGPAGSSSSSRQAAMTGGAVRDACHLVRDELFARARSMGARGPYALTTHGVLTSDGDHIDFRHLLANGEIERTAVHHHRRTSPLDVETGQGDAFVSYMFVGHRAVVDVDVELGLVRVVDLATVQDVGRVINPTGIRGQIEGGAAQGLGLAVMEELRLDGGSISNASFTDYLIPTALDMPRVRSVVLEYPDPDTAYGVKGAGEPPAISSGPAIMAAIENAVGRPLNRIPVRPQDIVSLKHAGESMASMPASH